MAEWTEGVAGGETVILRDGQPVPISEFLERLNAAESFTMDRHVELMQYAEKIEAQVVEMRKLLVRVKMYVPDSQQELHARIHYATEQ